MSEHTPGPWTFIVGDRLVVPAAKSGPDFAQHADVASICKVRHREPGTDHDNAEMIANGLLLAAATDLYKQLCNLEAWIRDAAASGGEGINWYAVNEIDGAEARAAIAKVKGGDA